MVYLYRSLYKFFTIALVDFKVFLCCSHLHHMRQAEYKVEMGINHPGAEKKL